MATIGLSQPFYAVYSNSGTAVTYSNGGKLGKYTALSIDLDDADNRFYADNAIAETDDTFSSGTVTITTDDLRPDAMLAALGLTSEAISATGVATTDAAWLVNSDAQSIPFLGIGGIAKKKVDGSIKYVGIVLDKIKFRNPGASITTQGESIEWQTSELTGDIYRSDKTTHDWRRITTLLDTEDEAAAAIKQYLSIT